MLNWFAIFAFSSMVPKCYTLPILTKVKHFVFSWQKNKKVATTTFPFSQGKGKQRLALCAQDFKQEGNFALEMIAEAVQRNKSLCPPILCQRKIVINTLQILLKEFPTYDKIMAPEM